MADRTYENMYDRDEHLKADKASKKSSDAVSKSKAQDASSIKGGNKGSGDFAAPPMEKGESLGAYAARVKKAKGAFGGATARDQADALAK